MAGSMVQNDYQKIGNDYMKERMRQEYAQKPDRQVIRENIEAEKNIEPLVDKIVQDMFDSGEFDLTDGGIREAVKEAARRVLQHQGGATPSGVSDMVENMDLGYAGRAEGMQMGFEGVDVTAPKMGHKMSARKPLPARR